MARSRNIKPGFFTNGELSEIDPLGRILFVGLWTIADKEGRLEDRPRTIKGKVLPFDDCDINALLNVLDKKGFIKRFEVKNEKYIQVINWKKHQNPHQKEAESTIPAPDFTEENTIQEQEKNVESIKLSRLIPDSLNLIPDSLKQSTEIEREFEGKQKISRTKKPVRYPLPENFSISENVKKWAEEKNFTCLDEHLEAFKRKAIMNSYAYADWDLAFMEAIREDWAKLRQSKNESMPAWWTSEELTEKKAKEVGCWPARGGENWAQYRQRIRQKIEEQAKGKR